MSNISKLQVFSYGFFRDILTLMHVLKQDKITKAEIEGYVKERLKELENQANVEKRRKKPKRSGKRRQWGTPVPGARPIGIKLKGEPCKGCKNKKESEIKVTIHKFKPLESEPKYLAPIQPKYITYKNRYPKG